MTDATCARCEEQKPEVDEDGSCLDCRADEIDALHDAYLEGMAHTNE